MISQGAEAIIERTELGVKKTRLTKTYRHPDLDVQLIKSRTKREAKVLLHLTEIAPKLINVRDNTIEMSYVDAPLIKDALTEENAHETGLRIGQAVKKMHDLGIVHHDLTTSNMFFTNPITLIDFGLSQFSETLEDKAVDLHVLKHALNAKHPHLAVWQAVLEGYHPEQALIERLEAVETRGRNKQK